MTPRRRGSKLLLALSLGAVAVAAVLAIARPMVVRLILGATLGAESSIVIGASLLAATAALLAFLRLGPEGTTARRLAVVAMAAGVVLGGFAWVRAARSYRQEIVHFESADGTPLAASLYLPVASGTYPGVVIVHGSAPARRHAYDVWAEPLVRAGYAVLLADKRGVGASGGVFDRENNTGSANIARLAGDVVAGVEVLSRRKEVDPGRIGLFGVSQAGWVAPPAALADARIRFMVMITAPTVSTREEATWSRLRGDDVSAATLSMADAERVMDTLASGGVDARESLGRLRIPALWLFGDADDSIPSRKSAAVLDSLRSVGAPYAHRTYAGYGHGLIGSGGRRMSLPHSPEDQWQHIYEWLEQNQLTTR